MYMCVLCCALAGLVGVSPLSPSRGYVFCKGKTFCAQ